MINIKHLCCIGLLFLGFTLPASLVRAQGTANAASKAGQAYAAALNAFNAGQYTQAATLAQGIIDGQFTTTKWMFDGTTPPPAPPNRLWLEPVFYLEGSAYFNGKDWPNAIKIFQDYLHLFPNSRRLAQVKFALAESFYFGAQYTDAIPIFTSLLPNTTYHAKAFFLLVEANVNLAKIPVAVSLLEQERTKPSLNPDFLEKVNARLLRLYLDNLAQDPKPTDAALDQAVAVLKQMDENIAHVLDVPGFNALASKLGDLFLSKKTNIVAALDCYRRVRNNDNITALQNQQIDYLNRQHQANLKIIQANATNPEISEPLQMFNKDIEDQVAKDQAVLVQYKQLPPILPPLFLRIGRAYAFIHEEWEAAVVYRELMRRFPQSPEVEEALYGSIVVFDRLKQTDRALDLCQTYLTQFPQGRNASDVGFMRGVLAFDDEQYDQAIMFFQQTLQAQPKSIHREQIELTIGDIKLREAKFDQAIASYDRYRKDYPQGSRLEKADYRTALALLFAGKGDDANAALNAYLKKYPNGDYVSDAEYRLAVIKFAEKDYDGTIAACKAWLVKYGVTATITNSTGYGTSSGIVPPKAEVLSLEGDALESLSQDDEAVKAYIQSYKEAHTVEVLDYSILAAANIMKKQGRWADIISMFQEFIAANPDHPSVLAAISWIGRADIKLGKIDEARQYLATAAKQYLNDPSREAVDDIITQLAELYARKHLLPAAPAASAPTAGTTTNSASTPTASAPSAPVAGATGLDPASASSAPVAEAAPTSTNSVTPAAPADSTPVAGAAPTSTNSATPAASAPSVPMVGASPTDTNSSSSPSPAPAPSSDVNSLFTSPSETTTTSTPPVVKAFDPNEDPATALEEILTIPDIASKPTAQARILFAKAELARLHRKLDIEKNILLDIATKFKPEDLSPILLGQTADCLLKAGQPAQADPFYHFLMDQYAQSPLVDYAYNGLAQIAYAQTDYSKAEKYFAKALDKGLASTKLKEITLGEAQCLLALNRPLEAKPYFEEVAGTRAWRGEATALSVFSLGECQMMQGHYPEANAYYQRVYVAYQKYPAIEAKAYLRSGEAFEKMDKVVEAANTYSEMLKNPDLKAFPEYSEAQRRLQQLQAKT
jgi:TolA-binding protein